MVISWPARIKDKGGLREQFMHVIDVVPTILEVTGIAAPECRGRHQAEADRGHQLCLHLRRQRQGAVPPQDPVLRDDGPVGVCTRRLAAEHQGRPRPVGRLRRGQRGSAQQPGVPALRPDQRTSTSPKISPRSIRTKVSEMRELFLEEAKKYQVLPAGCLGGRAGRRAASEPHRRAHASWSIRGR
jgi:hypothetical protein